MPPHTARPAVRLTLALAVALAALAGLLPPPAPARANSAYQPLPFSQSWGDPDLLTTLNDWSPAPGVNGYNGENLTDVIGRDPRIITQASGAPPQLFPNRTDPDTFASGGVAEFELPAPLGTVVALQGSDQADAPHIVINLNTFGYELIRLRYSLIDLDLPETAGQQVVAQYRVGESEEFNTLPTSYVSDASNSNEVGRVTPIDVQLPARASNAPQVQVRIITSNAIGVDAWIGIDDIEVTGTPISGGGDAAPFLSASAPPDGGTGFEPDASIALTFSEPVTAAADAVSLQCPAGSPVAFSGLPVSSTATITLNPSAALPASADCRVLLDPAKISDVDGTPNQLVGVTRIDFRTLSSCDGPVARISGVQGPGAATPCPGRLLVIEGVVVGDYEGLAPATLNGFYVQEEGADQDADPLTSEGIFVAPSTNLVAQGDRVRVTGTVAEVNGQTQITQTEIVVLAGGQALPAAASVSLPVPAPANGVDYLERFEGMRVQFPQALSVSDHLLLGRLGQVTLSSGGRLRQPTQAAEPGAPALAVRADNERNRIILDDPSQLQNPDPIIFARGGSPLSAGNTLRGGDTVTGLAGVLTYTSSGNSASPEAFRVRPAGGALPSFAAANPRPAAPAAVGGDLRVAGFDLLNYFNTTDVSGAQCFPSGTRDDCRGADNQTELDRQRAKLVAAIRALDADVLGLVELENNGYAANSALSDLVQRVNDGLPAADHYTFIDADARLGEASGLPGPIPNALGLDAVRVGLIYRNAVVEAIRDANGDQVNDDPLTFTSLDPTWQRRPLVQAFRERASGNIFSVAVSQFTARSCGGASGPEADQGDGQGCWNARRTAQADALARLLSEEVIPTVGDPDVLIVGELGAYAKEGPIDVLRAAGYIDLAAEEIGPGGYSYALEGQWGYLDYALASESLAPQVSGVAQWHINADEPVVLDYNTEFKSTGQLAGLYAADQFRSSDHDPILVGLDTTPPPPNQPPTLTSIGLIDGPVQGQPYTLSYAALAAAADEADPEGQALVFRVQQLIAGTLTKNGQPVQPGVTTLGAGESLVYTPASAGANVAGFSVVAFDGALASSPAVSVRFAVDAAGANRPPTLTTIAAIDGPEQGRPFTLSYAALAAAANEADPDGDPISFRVEQLLAGSLTKGGVAVTPGVTTLGAGESLVYTPAGIGAGVEAFTVLAFDGALLSAAPVTVRFNVGEPGPVNRPPTLTAIGVLNAGPVGQPFTISYAALAAAANEADPDGDPISFRVEQLIDGTLTKGGQPVQPGVTTLGAGESLVLTPSTEGSPIQAFTVVAYDGELASAPPVAVRLNVGTPPLNQPPTLTTISPIGGLIVGRPFTLSYAALAAAADEADPDGGPSSISFRVQQLIGGTLTKGGQPVQPGVTTLGPGESLVYTPAAPGGAVPGFSVVAYDGAEASSPPVAVRFRVQLQLYLPLLRR